MEKKRFYKVIRAFKHNGAIREFPFTLPYTCDIDVVGLVRFRNYEKD